MPSLTGEQGYSPIIASPPTTEVVPHIGTLNEGSLHATLKHHYSEPGDEFEVPLEGFVIDIRRPDQLIEIQTGSFGAMGRKLDRLLEEHRMLLVYPIAVESYLQRPDAKPRKSPKKASLYSLFDELVSIPTLVDHPNLTLDVVLVSVTKVQIADPKARRGRGGYRTVDRQLRHINATHRFASVADLVELLPDDLPAVFTTADMADAGSFDRATAQRMAYCFRALGVFEEQGRKKSGILYSFGEQS